MHGQNKYMDFIILMLQQQQKKTLGKKKNHVAEG